MMYPFCKYADGTENVYIHQIHFFLAIAEMQVPELSDAIPKVYKGSNAFFKGKGMSSTFSKIAAFSVTALFIAIII